MSARTSAKALTEAQGGHRCASSRAVRPLLTSLACGVVVLISFAALAVPTKAAFPGGNGKIVFARDGEIYTMNVNGTGRTQLTGNKGQDFDPAWSPDGTKVVFARNEDIYVMNADGSGQTNLTNGQANNHEPG
jgi:tricorn protease-like protein